ncbi:unnamed protein product, partial [marine sediment metagenome]
MSELPGCIRLDRLFPEGSPHGISGANARAIPAADGTTS